MGMGVFTLLAKLTKPVVVNWLLLPGTIVSEMAYIFGCLITGGEIRRSKLMPDGGAKGDGGAPATEAQPKLKFVGPMMASMLAIVACGAAIMVSHNYLGKTVIEKFVGADHQVQSVLLAPKGYHKRELPETASAAMNTFWDMLHDQVTMLKRTTNMLGELDWNSWKIPLFIYLSVCLAVRLSVASRPARPTLAAVVLIAVVIALLGLVWKDLDNLMDQVWPLLSYIWGLLLMVLVLSLLISGVVALLRALADKPAKKSS